MSPTASSPIARYAERHAILVRERDALEAEGARLSVARGVSFLAALGLGAYAMFGGAPAFVSWLAGALGAVFVALVIVHGRLVARSMAHGKRLALNERASQRARGEIADFPERGERFVQAGHAYAGDLDVFGRASLFQLLDTAQTARGQEILARWLAEPAPAPEIHARQEAAKELAALPALREELAYEGLVAGGVKGNADPVVAWAEERAELGPDAPASRRVMVRVASLAVPLTALLFLAGKLAPDAPKWLSALWLGPFVVQVAIWLALRGVIDPVVEKAASREAGFARYRGQLAVLEGGRFTSPRLEGLRGALFVGGRAASQEMAALGRLVAWAELRHGQLLSVLANLAFCYDLFCAVALEKWRRRAGKHVRGWLDTLGEVEALASLGTLAHDQPDYVFPEVTDGPPELVAEGLGHPLLPAAKRVTNDIAFGGESPVLLVTGSNMSGKSTMLRAVGVSTVLALAGAPVCAKRLALTPLRVQTSMRIADSLESGVSHFYAELLRLRGVVEAANAPGPAVLFLLDEVLHGTNSRERQIGAKAVVRHLLEQGAIGAVSSHDLGLATLEAETSGRVRNVHFEELVEDGKMTFDYRLKSGVVRTSNALVLMRLVGLDVPLDGPSVEV